MKMNSLKIISVVFGLTSFLSQAQAADSDESTLQILMTGGNPVIINAIGDKHPLTLNNLLDATASAASMSGSNTKKVSIDPNAISVIKIKKEGNEIKTSLYGEKGAKEQLTLGNFIANAAVNYPGCNADQINGHSINIKITFKKDQNNALRAYYVGENGEEDFNLGSLYRAAVIALNKCNK